VGDEERSFRLGAQTDCGHPGVEHAERPRRRSRRADTHALKKGLLLAGGREVELMPKLR
jgi:hypothetical protein